MISWNNLFAHVLTKNNIWKNYCKSVRTEQTRRSEKLFFLICNSGTLWLFPVWSRRWMSCCGEKTETLWTLLNFHHPKIVVLTWPSWSVLHFAIGSVAVTVSYILTIFSFIRTSSLALNHQKSEMLLPFFGEWCNPPSPSFPFCPITPTSNNI